MSNVPDNLKYTETHEWAKLGNDGLITVGITDHAQDLLGDMVYVELPEAGRTLIAKEECAVVESVKAASDIYAPINGEVVEVNEALSDAPELVNSEPYDKGWIMRIKPNDANDLNQLLAHDAYQEIAAKENH